MGSKEKCISLYKGNWWVNLFTNIRFWTGSFVQIERHIPKTGKILDLGCGYGIFGNYLGLASNKRKVLGIDTDANKVKSAEKGLPNCRFLVGDATKKELKNLNVITILDVLHHLDSYKDQERLISNCKEMLASSGKLVISDVDSNPFWKLILARITDFFMYKGAPVYYRYKDNMIRMLKKYFNTVDSILLEDNPFPHVLYICQKD